MMNRFKNLALKFLEEVNVRLQQMQNTFSKSITNMYESLSPTDTADEDNHYFRTLEWALTNRKNKEIKNIALTGPYGSGKSSILKSFQKKSINRRLKFLNISLATFKDQIDNENEKIPQSELLRLIELSILQQIFYRENDKDIPDSRFKKIESFSRIRLWWTALMIFLLLLAALNFIFPGLFQGVFKDNQFSQRIQNLIHYLTYAILIVGVFTLLLRSIRIVSLITVNKLKIAPAELTVADNANKSILNNNLDEIVYFFEVTKYNVVIIEDLDRFQQTEIFTKLREINLLLNSSKKTKGQGIVFIYAVRDDMFKDNQRTKFFDFIIPVIPIINSSNSSQIFLRKKAQHQYAVSDELIEDISLFIDDMRLVYNITNEFHLYRQKLDPNLDQNKTLAMVVYKNLFPYDFTRLIQNDGILFGCISSKEKLIGLRTKEIDINISAIKSEINELEKVRIRDVKDLRRIYVAEVMDANKPFNGFVIDYSVASIDDMVSDKHFAHLIEGALTYRVPVNYGGHQDIALRSTFVTAEKKLGSRTYQQRANEIIEINGGKIEALKLKIQDHEVAKNKLRSARLKDFLRNAELAVDVDDVQARDLISMLLRNGYITEDYLDYVSIFHEGSLTRADNQFLLCVKSQRKLDPAYKLTKVEEVAERINEFDFESDVLLNFDFLNFLLTNQSFTSLRTAVLKTLSNQSEPSVRFINQFVETSPNLENFIRGLCHQWPQIWKYIESESSYPKELKDKYLGRIIEFSELGDLKQINSNSGLKSAITDNPNFLEILIDVERLRSVIKTLDIKFTNLNVQNASKERLAYVFENNYYVLNVDMVRAYLLSYGKFDDTAFETRNYTALLVSEEQKLLERISKNMNEYTTNVYLQLENNTEEQPESLINLLNNEALSSENAHAILSKVNTCIDLDKIGSPEMRKRILGNMKIVPGWENLLISFNDAEQAFSEEMVAYLNSRKNSEAMALKKIPTDSMPNDFSEFHQALLLCNELSDDSYTELLKASPLAFDDLEIDHLSQAKVDSLIKDQTLTYSIGNLTRIAQHFPKSIIIYFEVHKMEFLKAPTLMTLDSGHVEQILNSKVFTAGEKGVLISQIPGSIIKSSPNGLRKIGELIIINNAVPIHLEILETLVITSEINAIYRVKIFNIKHSQLSKEVTTSFLNALGDPYNEITINGKRPLLENTSENLHLAQSLLSQEYISSFDEEKNGIRVITFRPKTET